ncbi:uncharacterized protein LOC117179991 [Belonocnema kinseyi]|uniref:uncharacterized protein LOC117179991 n=1 Tax=Belonocnema kinseyi TaxID=2817044 RepID=UPI00143CD223|nr:uncharacterized protein LOC117179991 [Belonocnema kinseyi]
MGKKNVKEGMSTFHSKNNSFKKNLKKPKIVSKTKKARLTKVLRENQYIFEKGELASAKDAAREFIKDFEEGESLGLLSHLSFLSKAIKRNLQITSTEGNLKLLIDPNVSKRPPIYLYYHKSGHWTRENKKYHNCDCPRINNCLFKAVASQINRTPAEIKNLTIKEMKINEKHIASKISDIRILELLNPFEVATDGLRYDGTSAKDAKKILDHSQKNTCHPQNLYGHPRGHASHPSATGFTESVENYSKNSRKTSFLSRSDQDMVAHLALDSDLAQEAIEKLNKGSKNAVVEISARELEDDNLPMANDYINGRAVGDPKSFRWVKAVLRHPSKKDKGVDIHVHTFFPRL